MTLHALFLSQLWESLITELYAPDLDPNTINSKQRDSILCWITLEHSIKHSAEIKSWVFVYFKALFVVECAKWSKWRWIPRGEVSSVCLSYRQQRDKETKCSVPRGSELPSCYSQMGEVVRHLWAQHCGAQRVPFLHPDFYCRTWN